MGSIELIGILYSEFRIQSFALSRFRGNIHVLVAYSIMDKETAEKIREACIKAAREGFMDASMSGLCNEGAVEAAISSIQMLNLEKVLKEAEKQP